MFLEHVNLTVSDLDRSITFYSELLETGVRWQGTTDLGGRAAHVGDDRHYVAMFENNAAEDPAPMFTTMGINHFGVVVDDLEAVCRRARKLGAEPLRPEPYEPGERAYIFDPDGTEIELVTY